MTNLAEMVWATDVEVAVLSLTRDVIKDREYHWSTIDRVEQGLSPERNTEITMSELEAWVSRCKTPPANAKEAPANDNPTRRVSPQNRRILNT